MPLPTGPHHPLNSLRRLHNHPSAPSPGSLIYHTYSNPVTLQWSPNWRAPPSPSKPLHHLPPQAAPPDPHISLRTPTSTARHTLPSLRAPNPLKLPQNRPAPCRPHAPPHPRGTGACAAWPPQPRPLPPRALVAPGSGASSCARRGHRGAPAETKAAPAPQPREAAPTPTHPPASGRSADTHAAHDGMCAQNYVSQGAARPRATSPRRLCGAPPLIGRWGVSGGNPRRAAGRFAGLSSRGAALLKMCLWLRGSVSPGGNFCTFTFLMLKQSHLQNQSETGKTSSTIGSALTKVMKINEMRTLGRNKM